MLTHKACVGGCSPGRSEESERRPDTWARLGAASPGPAPGHGAAVNPPEKPHPQCTPRLGQGCAWRVLLHNQQEGLGQEEQVLTWGAPLPPWRTWPRRRRARQLLLPPPGPVGLQVLTSALEGPGVCTRGDLARHWGDEEPRPAPLSPSSPASIHHPARLTGAALSARDALRKAHHTSPAPGHFLLDQKQLPSCICPGRTWQPVSQFLWPRHPAPCLVGGSCSTKAGLMTGTPRPAFRES